MSEFVAGSIAARGLVRRAVSRRSSQTRFKAGKTSEHSHALSEAQDLSRRRSSSLDQVPSFLLCSSHRACAGVVFVFVLCHYKTNQARPVLTRRTPSVIIFLYCFAGLKYKTRPSQCCQEGRRCVLICCCCAGWATAKGRGPTCQSRGVLHSSSTSTTNMTICQW